MGVLLPVLGRPAGLDLRHGAGGRSAGVRRAATLVPERSTAYDRAARAAYAAIPGHLLTSVAAGPWIRLYSFQSTPVLNAQLQAVISLASYATDSEDTSALGLATKHGDARPPRRSRSFDTGYWTYYALPRDYSDLDYQTFVVQLLTKLAPEDPRFADASKRFAMYKRQPPAFKLGTAGVGQVRFWLSKPSTVAVDSAAGPSRRLSLGDGWHTLAWAEPKRPGIYAVKLNAVDRAGNQAALEALPIVRAVAPAKPTAAKRATAVARVAPPSFVVGAGVDDPAQGALAREARPAGGSGRDRLAGTGAAPDPGLIAALQRVPAGQQVIAELSASPLPADDAGRAALAAYAASLAQQSPNVQQLILTPAPNAAGSAAYAAVLAAVRDAVHAGRSDRCGRSGGRRLDRAEGDRRGARAGARRRAAGPDRVPAGGGSGDGPLDDHEPAAAAHSAHARRSGRRLRCCSTG